MLGCYHISRVSVKPNPEGSLRTPTHVRLWSHSCSEPLSKVIRRFEVLSSTFRSPFDESNQTSSSKGVPSRCCWGFPYSPWCWELLQPFGSPSLLRVIHCSNTVNDPTTAASGYAAPSPWRTREGRNGNLSTSRLFSVESQSLQDGTATLDLLVWVSWM